MVDTAKLLATAQRLITANGRSVTFISYDDSLDDAGKPWDGLADPRGTPSDTLVVNAVFLPPGNVATMGLLTETDDLLVNSEQVMLVSPGAEDLAAFQEVLDGGSYWKIKGTNSLTPGAVQFLVAVGVAR